MKKLVLSAVFVAALSSTAFANSVTTSTGGGCKQSDDTGKSVEFGAELDTLTDEGTLFIKYSIQIGRDKLQKIDCTTMYNNETRRQNLELQRMQMEVDLLRVQIAEAKKNKDKAVATGDDW